MARYKLNVLFDSNADLEPIRAAGQRVTLMKRTDPGTPLAWIAFEPFRMNTVEWSDTYALYAAKASATHGTTIAPLSSETAASPQKVYSFDRGAFATGIEAPKLSPGEYEVVNDHPGEDWLTFGLAQDVQVNGRAYANHPINAAVVPHARSARFAASESLQVSLRAVMPNSLIVSEVASPPLTLTYDRGVHERTIRYEPTQGRFVAVD